MTSYGFLPPAPSLSPPSGTAGFFCTKETGALIVRFTKFDLNTPEHSPKHDCPTKQDLCTRQYNQPCKYCESEFLV